MGKAVERALVHQQLGNYHQAFANLDHALRLESATFRIVLPRGQVCPRISGEALPHPLAGRLSQGGKTPSSRRKHVFQCPRKRATSGTDSPGESVCVKTLGVRNLPFEAVPALQGTRLPLRPPGCSVYASSILFAEVAPTTPTWRQ